MVIIRMSPNIDTGSAVGIQFLGYENRKFKPTLLSHRLAEFAKQQNKGNEVGTGAGAARPIVAHWLKKYS